MPAMPDKPARQPATEVYAVLGADPEVQAYAMAKYSRSALSMKETLRELNQQKAEQFLNTFYFQYGHRSIADLAHIAMAIERLSLLAAIAVVDEQRWDGQERSTRYQDFKKSGYYIPNFTDRDTDQVYRETIDFLFSEYQAISAEMFGFLAALTPKPSEMAQEQYERTLRARAFDISRYLLPLATNTSLGQIVNARTLENQIARLLSDPHAEIRALGERLKEAAREPAYNIHAEAMRELSDEIRGRDKMWWKNVYDLVEHKAAAAPTLVKYANPSAYEIETRRELRHAAAEIMDGAKLALAPTVDLLDSEPLEIELATTLLYQHTHYPYRQIRERVQALSRGERNDVIALGMKNRGPHDELLRPFCAGQGFRFDILMDIGGYRDLHRHRRCIQIGQDFTTEHGFDLPDEIRAGGLEPRYESAMQRARRAAVEIAMSSAREAKESAQYLIPLAYRKRTLFKMDFAEVVYIAELRTGTGGHISYRRVAWAMYEAVAKRHPSLAQYFRVTDPKQPVDLLKR
jgi:thymidylate synthase ThyX